MKNLIDMDVYDSLELDGTDSVYLLNDTLVIDDYIHYFKNRITPNVYSSNYGKIIIDTEESELNPEIDPFQLYIIQDDDNEIEFSNKKYFLGLYNYDNNTQKNQWFLFYFTNRLLPVELKTSKL